jgi:hypothetical protein
MGEPVTPTLIATVDGQTFHVELHRVTGWDAITYRAEVGQSLDALVEAWVALALEADAVGRPLSTDAWPLADRAVLAWLWYRQNPEPNVTVQDVTSRVTLIPEPATDETVAGTDAPGPA